MSAGSGLAESTIRERLREGLLCSGTIDPPFIVDLIDEFGISLHFDFKSPLVLPWPLFEHALEFLDGKDWVTVAGNQDQANHPPTTLDDFLLGYLPHPPWPEQVATVLVAARLAEVSYRPSMRIRFWPPD